MNRWLDFSLVAGAVLLSAGYAIYVFGPKTLRDTFTRFVTRYFGLRSAKLFSGPTGCGNCGPAAKKPLQHNRPNHFRRK
jgi:hypothetical protein